VLTDVGPDSQHFPPRCVYYVGVSTIWWKAGGGGCWPLCTIAGKICFSSRAVDSHWTLVRFKPAAMHSASASGSGCRPDSEMDNYSQSKEKFHDLEGRGLLYPAGSGVCGGEGGVFQGCVPTLRLGMIGNGGGRAITDHKMPVSSKEPTTIHQPGVRGKCVRS
jgi:hypothetical protein